ncbi:9d01074f-f3cb-45b2-9caf-f4da12efe407 [Thermothielavioides terrestris]|uniref:Uncharacterized protein n=2 Tax=Thermothielavioides terrestris TaxID=2587410 RepID=G2REZ2_THETT|nr:uncharacterized protein THITE_2121491 [Thermothielavioides terrestris NRRL 8126]AEO70275.1 hypothetical protein THITE_2121491 [Thermothielavioides terrestris NRRL 8126]SPQ18080.1 9d01074f-f3cb-45b2-9caf-f4da12efe407 [Thermothielavioides terrestris]
MGLLSFGLFRPGSAKGPKLPLYKEVPSSSRRRTARPPRSPTKERYSDSEDTSDESGDGDTTDSSTSSSPSSRSSRRTSSSVSSAAALMPLKKRPATAARRPPVRRYLYRLPNRVIRYLCIAMMSTIVIFIFILVRASQLENRRIAEGKVDKKPVIPPPWEEFEFLTRYYGGVRSVVPLADNTPQYPRLEEEGPYNVTQPQPQQQQQEEEEEKEGSERREAEPPAVDQASVEVKPVPPSKAFTDYPTAGLPKTADGVYECFLDSQNTIRVPPIRYIEGRPNGFPDNILGSYELLSLPEDVCFERYGRYGPYGYGYSIRTGGLGIGEHGEREGAEAVWETVKQVDWRGIDWAAAQRQCYKANANRYKPLEVRGARPRGFYIGDGLEVPRLATRDSAEKVQSAGEKTQASIGRTAVVLRCWDEFVWREEDIANLRALISELSLASGGRYDVHLLVQVRNDGRNPVWADDDTYRSRINETVPEEFRGIVTLWSETQMLAVYQGVVDLWTRGPDLPVHGSYRGLQMAMQYFAYNHPEYDYFWQWEMDIRYTGHYHDLLSKLELWAKDQPRKGLWERNARYYVPHVHGTWEDFRQMSRVQTEHGTVGADNVWSSVPGSKIVGSGADRPSSSASQMSRGEQSIWGPERPLDENDWFEYESDPVPPTTYERDKYTWGVGEEADLLTLSPIFDPEGTTWGLADDITGYNETGGIGKPPRRAQIITASRMSRRLLLTMHRETAFKKHHAFPEMWPATVALHHGLKAVFAPHPVFVDRAWPPAYLARVLNGGRNGASGGARTAVYGDREHNTRGLTWFYNAGFPGNLYRRWLGLRVNNDGGEEFETTVDQAGDDRTVGTMRGGEGRMCLPPMLLHPVKEVDLPVEREEQEEEQQQQQADEKKGETLVLDPGA